MFVAQRFLGNQCVRLKHVLQRLLVILEVILMEQSLEHLRQPKIKDFFV